MSSTVSVLCAVWNNERYIEAALRSALGQSRPALEILVVDDGSTDRSAAIAESLPGVTVLREPHRGVAPTRNVALRHARGDLVAWLDSDDEFTPDKIAVQAGYMDAHPEIGMTFTHQRLVWEEGTEQPYWVKDEMLQGDSPVVGTCAMMVRRELFARVGDFDASKTPADDTDWIFRARDLGVGLATLPESLLLRRVHPANISTTMPVTRPLVLGMLRDALQRKRTGGPA